jgi:predicted RNase H-like nuclease
MAIPVAGVDGCKAGWFVSPDHQRSVFEVHPELCFLRMNNGQPMSLGKRTPEGMTARKELLIRNGFAAIVTPALGSRIAGVAKDDVLDACAACWTARRIALGVATVLPAVSPLDSRGLRMEMRT